MSNQNDFESDEQEAYYKEIHEREQVEEEPDVVPCFICGGQMYKTSNDPKLNLCTEHEK